MSRRNGRRRFGSPTVAAATGAAAVLAASGIAARRGRVSTSEEHVFRLFNGAPDVLHVGLWPVMQMGSLGAVYASAAAVHQRTGDRRAAAMVAVAGTAVWGGIKLVKPLVGRERPAALLADVEVRGPAQTGLGFPSGHAAVSLTLALLATRSPAARTVAVSAAALTGISRIYVGAHLPLDVLGGFAAGALAGLAGMPI